MANLTGETFAATRDTLQAARDMIRRAMDDVRRERASQWQASSIQARNLEAILRACVEADMLLLQAKCVTHAPNDDQGE